METKLICSEYAIEKINTDDIPETLEFPEKSIMKILLALICTLLNKHLKEALVNSVVTIRYGKQTTLSSMI